MITSFLGNFGTCANIRYQAAFPPPPLRPGYEASAILAGLLNKNFITTSGFVTTSVESTITLSFYSIMLSFNQIESGPTSCTVTLYMKKRSEKVKYSCSYY